MSKALPILGIVASVMAVLGALVLVDAAALLVPLVVLVVAVFLVLERQPMGLVSGVVSGLLALISLLGLLGNVSLKGGGGLGFGMSFELGQAFAVGSALVAAAGVMLTRAEDIVPAWVGYAGLALVAIGFVLALVLRDSLTDQQDGMTVLLGVIALLTIAPSVLALRNATPR